MARKSERRKSDRRKSDARSTRGSRDTARAGKSVAKAAPAAAAHPPAPAKIKFRGKLLDNEPLARYTTWRLGGPARYLALPADTEDVVRALELAHDRGLPWGVLGLGSNVLVKDGRFPGSVGGGIYMNAGCHGAEFSEVVTEVTVMDQKGKVKQLSRKQISFKYRSTNLEGIVLEAKLVLGEESPAKLKELQSKLLRWRKAGTPFDQPCCGSTFTNPQGGTKTAGMLIDECGLKGFQLGGAQVSTLHANYIINKGTATASDVLKVIEHVRKTVAKKTGVTLELECKIIGN